MLVFFISLPPQFLYNLLFVVRIVEIEESDILDDVVLCSYQLRKIIQAYGLLFVVSSCLILCDCLGLELGIRQQEILV